MAERAEVSRESEGLQGLPASVEEGQEGLLRRGLDWLSRLVRYDLAAVFELRQGALTLRMARGPLADNRVRHLNLRLEDFPTIRAALETRRARAFTESDHAHGDGDPFDGVLDFPHGHACMVVPLAAGERVFGVLTLDRQECERYPAELVDLVEVYGQVLGLALLNAEQRARLEARQIQREGYVRHLESLRKARSIALLEESEVPQVKALVARARQVAGGDTPVLLLGETDCGQVELARAIHRWSGRADQPFVSVDCRRLGTERLQQGLFGTGDDGERRGGWLALARGGSLFLEGVEALPRPLQQALHLATDADADVRLLASASLDLEEEVAAGGFDEALFFRLSTVQLPLVPVRERQADLPALVDALLEQHRARTGRGGLRASTAGMRRLRAHRWPGNLRELSNVVERAVLGSRADVLGPAQLWPDPDPNGGAAPSPLTPVGPLAPLEDMERQHIARVLAHCEGRIYGEGGAAAILGLKPTTLQSRMKRLGLTRHGP